MFSTQATKRHIRGRLGPWRGKETNALDPSFMNRGALLEARDLIFETPTEGRGHNTPGRVRPGRSDWNLDALYQRFYLGQGEAGESWTTGTRDTAVARFGYASMRFSLGAGPTTFNLYRPLPAAIDITNGQSAAAAMSANYIYFWFRTAGPSDLQASTSGIKLTSDVAPAAPAAWVDYVSGPMTAATFYQLAADGSMTLVGGMSSIPANTWVLGRLALSALTTTGGAFNPAAITQFNLLFSDPASPGSFNSYVDDVYIESTNNPMVVGLHEFLHATSGNKYLLAKAGDTLYVDKNETRYMTKIAAGMARNAPSYAARNFNQMFIADGDSMKMFDGILNSAGNYYTRAIGFPVPSAGSAVTTAAAGVVSTLGVHHCWISYIYGNGTTTYGQSSIRYIGTVTIGAAQKFSFSSLPVPTEPEGVIKKRVYIGLAGASQYADAYMAFEVAAAVTAQDVDIADETLSASTNPVGPIDNDIPPTARYLINFDGSMIYLRLAGNVTQLGYSRRGADINSGPEIVPAANLLQSQRGDAWTGGIVRGGRLVLFTRRSIHEGRFDAFGNLSVTELDQSVLGNHVAVGAIDQNSLWADDEGNIWFYSEQGLISYGTDGLIRFVSKDRLLTEYKDANFRLPVVNSLSYRNFVGQAAWDTGNRGNNLAAGSDGTLAYRYYNLSASPVPLGPNRSTVNNLNAGNINSNVGATGGLVTTNDANGQGDIDPGVNPYNLNNNKLEDTSVLYLLCRASQAERVDGVRFVAAKGNGLPQTVTCRLRKYKYELGRLLADGATVGTVQALDTSRVGAIVATATATNTGNTDDSKTWTATFGSPVFIPKGELYWVEINNASGSSIKFGLMSNSSVLPNSLGDLSQALNLYNARYSWAGTSFNFSAVQVGLLPAIGLFGGHQPGSVIDGVVDVGADVRRFAYLVQDGSYGMNASGRIELRMDTRVGLSDFTETTTNQTMFEALYTDPTQAVNTTIAPSAQAFHLRPAYDPAGGIGYPALIAHRQVHYYGSVDNDSAYGNDIQDESQSLISTSYDTTFMPETATINVTGALVGTAPDDELWESPVIDMTSAPTAWGRFEVEWLRNQQNITLQARCDSDPAFVNFPDYHDIPINTVPVASQLAFNGRYVQLRLYFKDDPTLTAGIVTQVAAARIAWQATDLLAPLLPPAGCFFDRYHLLAYTPTGGRLNTRAWCVSPGIKLSEWFNQPVNCWCVYDNKLLAGKNGVGKISRYWNEDVQDDGALYIQALAITQVTYMGYENIKTLMGATVNSGVREYKDVYRTPNPSEVLPAGPGLRGDQFALYAISGGSTALQNTPFTVDVPGSVPNTANVLNDSFYGTYQRESHSTSQAVGVVGGDLFFWDLLRQDLAFKFAWIARSHQIYNPVKASYVTRFPYLTDIEPEFFVENFYGV